MSDAQTTEYVRLTDRVWDRCWAYIEDRNLTAAECSIVWAVAYAAIGELSDYRCPAGLATRLAETGCCDCCADPEHRCPACPASEDAMRKAMDFHDREMRRAVQPWHAPDPTTCNADLAVQGQPRLDCELPAGHDGAHRNTTVRTWLTKASADWPYPHPEIASLTRTQCETLRSSAEILVAADAADLPAFSARTVLRVLDALDRDIPPARTDPKEVGRG